MSGSVEIVEMGPRDGLQNGVVTHVNAPAAAAGVRVGQAVRDAAQALGVHSQ